MIVREKVPCKECMLFAVCKYKNWNTLMADCSTLHDLVNKIWWNRNKHNAYETLTNTRVWNVFILDVKDILKPSRWKLEVYQNCFYIESPKKVTFKIKEETHDNAM